MDSDDVHARPTLFNDTSRYAEAGLVIPSARGLLEVVGCPGIGVDHANRDPRRPTGRLDVGISVTVGGRSLQLYPAWPPHSVMRGVI
jgi:hypothetical protein